MSRTTGTSGGHWGKPTSNDGHTSAETTTTKKKCPKSADCLGHLQARSQHLSFGFWTGAGEVRLSQPKSQGKDPGNEVGRTYHFQKVGSFSGTTKMAIFF